MIDLLKEKRKLVNNVSIVNLSSSTIFIFSAIVIISVIIVIPIIYSLSLTRVVSKGDGKNKIY